MSSQVEDFRAVFDATYPKLVAYARRRVDDSVVDDIVSETFLVAWRRRTEVAGMDNPLPWLYAVAGNQLRNQDRSANRHLRLVSKVAGDPATSTEPEHASTPPAGHSDSDPAVDLIRGALETLSFDDQEVLRLVTWEELTYQQTADALGCSVDAVGQRIRRAKQRLARAIENLTDHHTTSRTDTHPRGA